MNMNRQLTTIACAATALAVLGSSAKAAYTWNGSISGDWSVPGNWNEGVPVDTVAGGNLETPSTERLVFNVSSGNIVPTSNIPALGGVPDNSNTNNTPEIDLLNGSLTFTAPGFSNQGLCGPRGGVWTTTVGDGILGNGTASLTLVGNFSQGLARDGQVFRFQVASDGTLTLDGNGSGGALWLSYDTGRRVEVLLDGGSFTTPDPLEMLRNSTDLGPSFFDLRVIGSTVTADFGVDFADIDAVRAATGDGLTFRSSTMVTLSAEDNMDGTFTVTAVPEPGSLALLGFGGLMLGLRRRR